MNLPAFADDLLQIDVGATARCQASIEGGCGLASRFANLIGFKRAFDDIGYGTIFATRKSMREVTRLCATD